MTTANLLIVLLVGTVVGALAGLALDSFFPHSLYLGIVAGFLATIIAGVVRNTIMARITGVGPDTSSIPTIVILYSAIASLAGSAAAVEVAHASHHDSPVWIGTLAGLFSSILMALLMVAYYMDPRTGELKSTKRK
jgi:uncharacterized BrkB/YihY/UPF0761 family membrane protein